MSISDPRILVVDDDRAIRVVLETGLRARGYRVSVAATGEEGLGRAAVEQPDVVVVDLGLPDMDGVAVCRRIREWSDVPIVVLSAHGAEDRKILALDAGADDFVTKPFSMQELLARIRVGLRHRQRTAELAASGPDAATVQVGTLTIDVASRRVTVGDEEVTFTDKEFAILAHLAGHAGRVVTHQQLLDAVWGPGYAGEVHYLRVYLNRVRKKLASGPDSPSITTLPRVGYRLELPEA